jgi:hypothetical protein
VAIDTAQKRAASGGMPFPLGPNVVPGELATLQGRAASAYTYVGDDLNPPPAFTSILDRLTLGTVESFSISPDPGLGGRGSF